LLSFNSTNNSFHYAYTYDCVGNLIKAEDVLNKTTTLRTYDKHSRVINETLSNGLRLEYAYDDVDRCIQLILPYKSDINYSYKGIHLSRVDRQSLDCEAYCHIYETHNFTGQPTRCILPHQVGILENTYDIDKTLKKIIL
jgi:YD repeat-containing protein